MFIYVENRILRKAFLNWSSFPEGIKNRVNYDASRLTKHEIQVEDLDDDDIGKIKSAALWFIETDGDVYYKSLIKKIDQAVALKSRGNVLVPLRKLDELPLSIKSYVGAAPHKLCFRQTPDGVFLPYLITKSEYYKAAGRGENRTEAYCVIDSVFYVRGKSRSASWTIHSVRGRNVAQILESCGLYIETEEMIDEYKEALKGYLRIKDKIGLQMFAMGTATRVSTDRWGYNNGYDVEMVRDGELTKVVIDDESDEIENDSRSSYGSRSSSKITVGTEFYGEPAKRVIIDEPEDNEKPDDENPQEYYEDEKIGYAPIHPHVKVFDLTNHDWLTIYSQNLMDYPWNKSLMDKLILPDNQKTLISMLMETTKVKHDDIVKGKMQGVIVLATGIPGVGKTLTAEIFGEFIEKPLYSIQCSQLGLGIDDIEQNLSKALNRANRWNAILLIDEADVYIRQRGEDILQNAIVGVFLRLIEYYSGIMFMTSNRGDIIDDAIISRATAWIKYNTPDEFLLKKIWSVLGNNYGVEFTEDQLNDLVNDLPSITGRTVRNLLKLAALLASKNEEKITPELVIQVKDYQKLD